jgi:hypothetical protein
VDDIGTGVGPAVVRGLGVVVALTTGDGPWEEGAALGMAGVGLAVEPAIAAEVPATEDTVAKESCEGIAIPSFGLTPPTVGFICGTGGGDRGRWRSAH